MLQLFRFRAKIVYIKEKTTTSFMMRQLCLAAKNALNRSNFKFEY